jgi:serine/threonine-protein kinase RsbW
MAFNGTMRSGPMVGEDQEEQGRDEALARGGDVRLSVPAAPEYLRLVRLTAAGLASRLGFTFDEVEDLRIAVDELCFHLLGQADGVNGEANDGVGNPSEAALRTMDLTYSAGDDFITITGRTGLTGPVPEPSELSEQILDALVDDHEVSGGDGVIMFRLTKQRES